MEHPVSALELEQEYENLKAFRDMAITLCNYRLKQAENNTDKTPKAIAYYAARYASARNEAKIAIAKCADFYCKNLDPVNPRSILIC